MKKNGFLAMIGLITLIAAALVGAYYFLNKKRECILHCGDGTCEDDMDDMEEEENCDCIEGCDGGCSDCGDLPEEGQEESEQA